jgi:FkbM family methyltransferase
MGAIHFSLDLELVRALQRAVPLRIFVETGTFRGDTAASIAGEFTAVVTIEVDNALHAAAAARLAGLPNVTARRGASQEVLAELAPGLANENVLYWLDAHWCGVGTGGQQNECPLDRELAAIRTLNATSIVLIDDARLFLAPPPAPHDANHWPRLEQVVDWLGQLNPRHRLWIVNDVFIFAPPEAQPQIVEYARTRGVDLARLAQIARATSSGVPRLGRAGRANFNAEFLTGERSERIFAHHLGRLGIERVLDVGANTGQFAKKLRRCGFAGTIYSVEPQRAAYETLLASARTDARWIVLARQGAGAERRVMELNIAENGWSSSFRPVHANHVAAEHSTRTIGRESVIVSRCGELLRPQLMAGIEALKIDVQGFEDQVLEGYGSWLPNVRLLLLELSLVECYAGAPDLFALDRRLVGEFGFSRVSLEPSYYDDTLGIVQQYDGIYYRPQQPPTPAAEEIGVRIAGVVTSIGGELQRLRADGVNVGPSWMQACVQSWIQFGVRVASLSETPAPPGIEWIQAQQRPSIAAILGALPVGPAQHLLVSNADILFSPEFKALLPKLDRQAVYYGQRLDVRFDAAAADSLTAIGVYPWGFDYFLLPSELVRLLGDENPLPPEYKIGEPWWDYAVPLFALARGFAVKRLPASATALHLAHPQRYSPEQWLQNGLRFEALVKRLRAETNSHATSLLEALADCPGEPKARLEQISALLCASLP